MREKRETRDRGRSKRNAKRDTRERREGVRRKYSGLLNKKYLSNFLPKIDYFLSMIYLQPSLGASGPRIGRWRKCRQSHTAL